MDTNLVVELEKLLHHSAFDVLLEVPDDDEDYLLVVVYTLDLAPILFHSADDLNYLDAFSKLNVNVLQIGIEIIAFLKLILFEKYVLEFAAAVEYGKVIKEDLCEDLIRPPMVKFIEMRNEVFKVSIIMILDWKS